MSEATPDDVAPLVDALSGTAVVAGRQDVDRLSVLPQHRAPPGVLVGAAPADDLSPVVDVGRHTEHEARQHAQVDELSVPPQHGAVGVEAGDLAVADRLPGIVDRKQVARAESERAHVDER
jgi:hypothetical protein